MRRFVVVLFIVVAPTLPLAAAAAATGGGAPSALEKVVFVEYAAGPGGQRPSADASSDDFHLLGGHPAWGTTDVNYDVNTLGCSGSCSGATAAVDAAFNTWSAVSGITLHDGAADTNPCGGTNSVTWAAIDGTGGTLAVTSVCRVTSTKQIVGFQTVFDSGDLWSDSGGDATHFDIQATATHEEGHTLGLDHVHSPFDARLTMYPYITPGDDGFRTLGCGDRLGVNAIYGTNLNCDGVPLD